MLAELDSIGLMPQGMLWLYFHGVKDWRLTVVSDLLSTMPRQRVYALIGDALDKHGPIDGLTVFDVHLYDSSEIIPRILGGALQITGGRARILDGQVNGMPVDALVYRLMPPRDPGTIKRAAKAFEKKVMALA